MQRHIVGMWCGVFAIIVAGVSFAGMRIFEEERPRQKPTRQPKPLVELATGFRIGMTYPWYRKFLLARLIFMVELVMPFHTIHASTNYIGAHQVGTKHTFSYSINTTVAGKMIGSIQGRWLSGRISVKPDHVAGMPDLCCLGPSGAQVHTDGSRRQYLV